MPRCDDCNGCGSSSIRPLSSYRTGFRGKVFRLLPAGDSWKRMLEMGLTPGTEVEIVGTAPMGDPIQIALRGYRLTLRRNEADLVEVSTISRTYSKG